MNTKRTYKDFQKLTTKDIMQICEMSESSANRLKKNIKIEFNIKVVLYIHFKKYFFIP